MRSEEAHLVVVRLTESESREQSRMSAEPDVVDLYLRSVSLVSYLILSPHDRREVKASVDDEERAVSAWVDQDEIGRQSGRALPTVVEDELWVEREGPGDRVSPAEEPSE